MKSFYAQYIEEREGKKVLETHYGFIIYEIEKDFLFIQDLFIVKEKRKNKLATEMVDMVVNEAKELGCKELHSIVDLRSLNCSDSFEFALKYGSKVNKQDGNILFLKKDI